MNPAKELVLLAALLAVIPLAPTIAAATVDPEAATCEAPTTSNDRGSLTSLTPGADPVSRQLADAAAARSVGDYPQAASLLDQARVGAEQSEDAGKLAAVAIERGVLFDAMADFDRAREAYREAERLAFAAGLPRLAQRASANAARATLAADSTEGVEATLVGILDTEDDPSDPGRAGLLIHVGRSFVLLSDRAPARRQPLRLKAAQAYSRALPLSESDAAARLRSYALGYLAQLYEADARFEDALGLNQRALFAAQKADAPESIYRWQWQIGRIERARGNPTAALAAYRQSARTLEDLRGDATYIARGLDATFANSIEPIYLGLVDLLLATSDGEAEPAHRQRLYAEARGVIEDLRAAELRDYYRDPCLDDQRKASIDDIPGALIIYPIELPDRLELIVSESGRFWRFTSNVSREKLRAIASDFRRTLVKRSTWECLTYSRQLHDWLIRPLRPIFEERSIDTLVFVAGGALRSVPMAALQDRESKSFVIEEFPVAMVPGLSLVDPVPIDREDIELLAAGVSSGVQGFSPLENVNREIEEVSKLFPGETLLNDQFSAEQFEKQMSSRPFGIVHIASHGKFSAEASESFILTFDEELSMNQMGSIVGKTRFRDEPLELLALSACETAAGDERASLGLAGVALRAGARSTLATLWLVHDQASAQLVTSFYRELAKPDVPRAVALQKAQLGLLQSDTFAHPGYWSAFVLLSSWL